MASHTTSGSESARKPGEQRIEAIRQLAKQPRRFHPVAQAFFSCFVDQ